MRRVSAVCLQKVSTPGYRAFRLREADRRQREALRKWSWYTAGQPRDAGLTDDRLVDPETRVECRREPSVRFGYTATTSRCAIGGNRTRPKVLSVEVIIEVKKRGDSDEEVMHKFDVIKGDVTSAISNSHGLGVADLVV